MALLTIPAADPLDPPEEVEYVHSVEFRKGIDGQGPYYDCLYYIDDWAKVDRFVNTLKGIGPGIVTPHRHPLSPNLLCQEAHVMGRGREITDPLASPATSGLPNYAGGAAIRAVYRSPVVGAGFPGSDWDPGWAHQIDPANPVLWATMELSSATETLSYQDSGYVWESDNAKVETAVQFDVDLLIMSITFHRLRFLPIGPLRQYRRRINDGAFLGAPDEHVWFQSFRTRLQVDTDGSAMRDATLVFAERPVSWNKLLRPGRMPTDPAAWQYVRDGNNFRRLPKANLWNLLSSFQ